MKSKFYYDKEVSIVNDIILSKRGNSMYQKEERLLKIFYGLLRGEEVRTNDLSNQYNVSTRTISRDLELIKCILADNREVFGNAEIIYDKSKRAYCFVTDVVLKANELLAVVEILIASRGLEKSELVGIVEKLRRQVSCNDKKKLSKLLQKELFSYKEIKHDERNVIENLWRLSNVIEEKRLITITYYKMSREKVKRKIYPEAVMFSEYYFYLIARDVELNIVKYFRIDRIVDIVIHRQTFTVPNPTDEGKLRNEIQYMWPGDYQKVKFEFSGPSVQAVLDKVPKAEIVEMKDGKYIIQAEVLGDGILMFLLSQRQWVRLLEPETLVQKLKDEIREMYLKYQ